MWSINYVTFLAPHMKQTTTNFPFVLVSIGAAASGSDGEDFCGECVPHIGKMQEARSGVEEEDPKHGCQMAIARF